MRTIDSHVLKPSRNAREAAEGSTTTETKKPSVPFVKYPASLFLFFVVFACFAAHLPAQTTLSGDHVITGDLHVGTTGTNGNLTVTGETGGSAAPGLTVTGHGGVMFSGTFGTGQIPASGAGTRLMWYPKKAALRAGRTFGTEWDDASVGNYSAALGYKTEAKGEASVAMGYGSYSRGYASLAVGHWAAATGYASIAIGYGASASGYRSTAIGGSSHSTGYDSVALGTASALNAGCTAMGYSSAIGIASTAMGHEILASSYSSTAMGRSNVGGGSPTEWREEDPLFEIGNGTGTPNDPNWFRNALTMRKNANMRTAGVIEAKGGLRAAPLGDLSMGDFTAGQNPATLNKALKYSGE